MKQLSTLQHQHMHRLSSVCIFSTHIFDLEPAMKSGAGDLDWLHFHVSCTPFYFSVKAIALTGRKSSSLLHCTISFSWGISEAGMLDRLLQCCSSCDNELEVYGRWYRAIPLFSAPRWICSLLFLVPFFSCTGLAFVLYYLFCTHHLSSLVCPYWWSSFLFMSINFFLLVSSFSDIVKSTFTA